MRISIIVPVYNSEGTLDLCLTAIFKSDLKDYEVVVVDDASCDASVKIAQKYPCRLIALKENKGAAAVRNIGAGSAIFCHKVLKMLLEEGKITKKTIELIMSWRHSGFNVDSHVYIDANNTKGLEGLVQYIVRAPLSQGKILAAKDKVVYRSKINPRIKSNFRIYDPLDWIAAVTSHIPDKGQQMVRYYGYYSNVKRGRHRKNGITPEYLNIKEPILSSKEYRRRWQDLIKKVYETDPLICPKCGGKMNIISFVKEKLIIDRILTHKGLPQVYSHSPPEEKKVSTELIRVACYD